MIEMISTSQRFIAISPSPERAVENVSGMAEEYANIFYGLKGMRK